REALSKRSLRAKIEKEYAREWLQVEGTERSLEWYRFLLSDESPWKDIFPFVLEMSPEYVNRNDGALIFHKLSEMPLRLWYNFLMAERFPWELPLQFSQWYYLRELLP